MTDLLRKADLVNCREPGMASGLPGRLATRASNLATYARVRIEFSYHHARGDRAASEGRAAAFAGTSLISQSRFRGANHNMSISFPSWSMALARLP
jgi:hypothetical protein